MSKLSQAEGRAGLGTPCLTRRPEKETPMKRLQRNPTFYSHTKTALLAFTRHTVTGISRQFV